MISQKEIIIALLIFEGVCMEIKLKKRAKESNKGDFGKVLCICGSYTMPGAAIMAVRAALRCGVGLTNLAIEEKAYPLVASSLPESVFTLYKENDFEALKSALKSATCVLIGCGLSKSDLALEALKLVIENSLVPIIIDADGINLLSEHIDLLKNKKAPVIITPHPKEMSRITGKEVSFIQKNREEVAKETSKKLNVTVVLKGSGTIVTDFENVYINETGNPGMAKGGSGDVLAGMLASFVAQGYDLFTASKYAVYLHGLAGDRCAEKYSQVAMLPTDIIEELPNVFLETER